MAWLRVLLGVLLLLTAANSLPPVHELNQLSQDDLLEVYFEEGFTYQVILRFLAAFHGIFVSLSTLKRALRRQLLRRRGGYSSLSDVRNCILVSALECM